MLRPASERCVPAWLVPVPCLRPSVAGMPGVAVMPRALPLPCPFCSGLASGSLSFAMADAETKVTPGSAHQQCGCCRSWPSRAFVCRTSF